MTRSHLAPAPFVQHRHPRCVTPPNGTSLPPDDTAVIADLRRLNGELEAKVHQLAGRLTVAEGALELLRVELGLPADAAPPAVIEAAHALKADRDGLLLVISRITEACGLPDGLEPDKVIQRIEELA